MSKPSVHTTIRELSLAISQREKKVRELRVWITWQEQRYDDSGRRLTAGPEVDKSRKDRYKQADAIDQELPELRGALAQLCSVVAKGYV